MRRLHLFEVLDQSWCPQSLRDGATDYLEAITSAGDIYRPVRPQMLAAIEACRARHVVDLCSGGGGPWLSPQWRSVLDEHPELRVTLTDKFPSRALSGRLDHSQLRCASIPVDATRVPEELTGFRTIFSSFHHFPDPVALQVLSDAVDRGDGVATAEVTSRSIRAIATMLLMPLFAKLLTPRMRPFRWSRLLLTYIVPAIPIVVLWDGLVSCLRTRTPEELLALTKRFPQYLWTAGYGQGSWLRPVYLIGIPRGEAELTGAQA